MNFWGSGFIPIIIYAGFSEGVEQQKTILTENSIDLLTESDSPLLVE